MSKEKDGGAAFPRPLGEAIKEGGLYYSESQSGMTLRDWFAGQALTGWIAAIDGHPLPEDAAMVAYSYADAMLAARDKKEEA